MALISSQSYLVRWVDVKSEHTISWSIQPHKKSINFGLFKHPGSHIAPPPRVPSSTFEAPPTPGLKPSDAASDSLPQHSSAAVEKLKGIGMKLVLWHGNCEANMVTTGKYDVPKGEGGMYALVFDNTFAKSLSKTATFALLTYPTNTPPQSAHQLHHIQGASAGSAPSLRLKPSRSRPKLNIERQSSDSIPTAAASADLSSSNKQGAASIGQTESIASSSFFTGVLHKRRRKRHQGYARRFFSLDFTTSTLSYYHDRNAVSIRGSVPLSLAAIAANAATREISIDSGAEVWHLRAPTRKEFDAWKDALESASRPYTQDSPGGANLDSTFRRSQSMLRFGPDEEREWMKIEALVSKIGVSRDMARHIAQDTDPKYLPVETSQYTSNTLGSGIGSSGNLSQYSSGGEASPSDPPAGDDFFETQDRRPFWKRKTSSGKPSPFKRSTSAQAALPRFGRKVSGPDSSASTLRNTQTEGVHEQCMGLLRTLDTIVAEFSALLIENKQRRMPVPVHTNSRLSLDSVGSQEFFDAEAGEGSQLLTLQPESDDGETTEHDFVTDEHEESSASEIEDEGIEKSSILTPEQGNLFPTKVKTFNLSAAQSVVRRKTVKPPVMNPPSLIGFLRKNVGKDLSTISMPVSANEPISLLQKSAEQLEYSALLDEAARVPKSKQERLLYVTAFAISNLSVVRVKERAIRKPFNPMLGETYELIREDRGYRFLAEKVCHRPVIIACQADAEKWSLSQTPIPTQKFWGKSAELNTEGKVRVSLHETGDKFSWTPATCFLRNIIAGEKYVEPFGTMTVKNETTGEHVVVTFKVKGMFSGRSEEVSAQMFDEFGNEMPLSLTGKWTHSLAILESGTARNSLIWTAGDLVPDAPKCYGFTTFAASLNEMNSMEEPKLPATDSRFRPDQRAAEDGDIDTAELLKSRLEEAQRERRRRMDEQGVTWTPMWFSKVEGVENETVWRLKGGKEGYWETRAKGDWKGMPKVLEL